MEYIAVLEGLPGARTSPSRRAYGSNSRRAYRSSRGPAPCVVDCTFESSFDCSVGYEQGVNCNFDAPYDCAAGYEQGNVNCGEYETFDCNAPCLPAGTSTFPPRVGTGPTLPPPVFLPPDPKQDGTPVFLDPDPDPQGPNPVPDNGQPPYSFPPYIQREQDNNGYFDRRNILQPNGTVKEPQQSPKALPVSQNPGPILNPYANVVINCPPGYSIYQGRCQENAADGITIKGALGRLGKIFGGKR